MSRADTCTCWFYHTVIRTLPNIVQRISLFNVFCFIESVLVYDTNNARLNMRYYLFLVGIRFRNKSIQRLPSLEKLAFSSYAVWSDQRRFCGLVRSATILWLGQISDDSVTWSDQRRFCKTHASDVITKMPNIPFLFIFTLCAYLLWVLTDLITERKTNISSICIQWIQSYGTILLLSSHNTWSFVAQRAHDVCWVSTSKISTWLNTREYC